MKNPIRDLPHYLKIFQTYLGRRMYYVFALSLLAGLAEGVGILMFLPLLQSLDSGSSSATGEMSMASEGVSAHVHDLFSLLGIHDSTVGVLIIITLAFLFKGALTFGALGFSAYLRGQLLRELKGRLFDHYSNMTYGYYSSRDTGYFINLINEQITRALQSFNSTAQLGTQSVNALVYLALAFVVAWRFGLMALGVGILLVVLFRKLNGYVRNLSRKTASENGHLAKLLIQALHAFKYLTATDQTAGLRRSITVSIHQLTGYQMRTGIAAGFTQAAREPIAVVFIMLIVLIQIELLKQPLAPILVSILLFYRGLNAMLSIQSYWQGALEQIGSMELVHQEFTKQRQYQGRDGPHVLGALDKAIRLDDLHFRYDQQLDDVIKGVNLEIPVRTTVALVGESGAGKSTLVDLITLMHNPNSGQVLIDGFPGENINLSSWRQQIGYVSQETVVFDDTIANNICMWADDSEQGVQLDDRIREAARQAHIAHFIESLPDGYQTLVGDRGLRLSGGQRQRLFIARELYRKPNLLILDEATSALDSESERAIQKSIDELKGHITVIIIAHRLSTIRNVDKVYVFEQGQLVEEGGYEKLRDTKDSRFGRLVAMQAL
ncbi:ABC transporter ATP-binding protein [Solemya pervernicosa gill symbiont]|uniref:ABC transporter ATP-binding protein n=1 Tax=Solemya pervernicosa gill symbiont TaxID=642797 RepID=A0A1T2L5U4_9GAMM|nr:ABC transporter ATP-binding protein [Solemya pervernicosa gill symbiont]OOZ40410.1 ABC transporter ATP-binding protein [Solemya pervernicosa gill symbiont]